MFLKTTEYALRATIFIAQKGSAEKKLSIGEISGAIGSPNSYTAKIMQLLTKDNIIVSSARGPNGGFYMTEKAKKKSVMKILEITGEGEIYKKCILGLHKCSEINPCPMHHQYKSVKKHLMELFEKKTIQQLAGELLKGTSIK